MNTLKQNEIITDSYAIENPKKRAEKWIEERKAYEAALETIEEQKKKNKFVDIISNSDIEFSVQDLISLLNQNDFNTCRDEIFCLFRENGYFESDNSPSKLALDLDLFTVEQNICLKGNGSVVTSTKTKITGKGIVYFVTKILNCEYAYPDFSLYNI